GVAELLNAPELGSGRHAREVGLDPDLAGDSRDHQLAVSRQHLEPEPFARELGNGFRRIGPQPVLKCKDDRACITGAQHDFEISFIIGRVGNPAPGAAAEMYRLTSPDAVKPKARMLGNAIYLGRDDAAYGNGGGERLRQRML